MGRITWELIRKKTEHHDGLLEDLEELTLHQLNLEKLETIGRFCPRLKILYLQNNLIPRLENLKRLSSLIYLNVALNNITEIGPEICRCEKLRKLDLTLNFIDVLALESSLANLAQLEHLDELYLTGNPCTTAFAHYRALAVHRLPRLSKLDGVDITRMERLQARSALASIEDDLRKAVEAKRAEKGAEANAAAASSSSAAVDGQDDDDLAEAREKADPSLSAAQAEYAAKSAKVSAYTPESRTAQHLEAEAFEAAKAREKAAASTRGASSDADDMWKRAQEKMNAKVTQADLDALGPGVLPKQRNMGKWEFSMVDSPPSHRGCVVFDLTLPKFLDTSLIEVDVHPEWLQVHVKGKAILLHWPAGAEVAVRDTKIQRNKANGHLIVICTKVKKINANTFTTQAEGTAKQQGSVDSDDDDDREVEKELARSEAASKGDAAMHANVVDLSSGSRAAAAASSASAAASSASATAASRASSTGGASSGGGGTSFVTNNVGGGLNQAYNYRNIARARTAEATAAAREQQEQLREVAVTRSATLEEARLARMQAAADEATREKMAAQEEMHREMQSLGLDDSGVPDLE